MRYISEFKDISAYKKHEIYAQECSKVYNRALTMAAVTSIEEAVKYARLGYKQANDKLYG